MPYKLGNVVKLGTRFNLRNLGAARIARVDYLKADEFCDDDATPYPIYVIECDELRGAQTYVNGNDIASIISPGNYVYWETDKTKLNFKDLRDEVGFYKSIGKINQVKNQKEIKMNLQKIKQIKKMKN